MNRTIGNLMTLLISLIALLPVKILYSHDGPPFPILVDHSMKEHTLSIWTDPDVGDGTFFFYLVQKKASSSIITPRIQLSAKLNNQSSLGPFTAFRNLKMEQDSGRTVYEGHIPFSSEDKWKVQFDIDDENITLDVDVTPDGPSPWEFALYFLPFLSFGFIWLKMIIMKSKAKSTAEHKL